MVDFWLFSLAVASYATATLIWLGFVWFQDDHWHRFGTAAVSLGWLSHTLALLWETVAQGFFPVGSLGAALSLFSWTLTTAFLILNWRYPVKVLGAMVTPLAALLLVGSLSLPRPQVLPPILQSFWLSFHIAAALLGNATFALACLGGILYLIQERQLKGKKFGFFYKRLPSLETLDALNYYCINIGFILLTLGIITGSLYAQYTLGTFWQWDPKETMTLIAWLLYAGLLHERLAKGWRGRRAALMAIAGFIVLLVTLVGTDFWHKSYHRFDTLGRLP